MDSFYCYKTFTFFVNFILLSSFSSAQDESGLNDDMECDLNSASKCISSSLDILNCFNKSTTCSSVTPDETFEEICNSMNYTINGCLMDILGYGCKGTEREGFYQQWLNPINAVLNKLCSRNESTLRILVQILKSDCGKGSFINCLRQTEEKINIIDLVSTEMTAETCTDLDLRLQLCQFMDPHCESLVDIFLALGKEFLDNAVCKNQPFILVPLEDKDKSEDNSKESEDERDCAPRFASVCFDPMLVKWSCYFQEKKCSTDLTELCSFTEYSLNTCGMDILGYGCENTPKHHYYQDWLLPMNSIYMKMCGENNGLGENSKIAKVCWWDFMSCIQKSEIARNTVNLITSKITSSVCMDVADSVESCLFRLNIPQCDDVIEIVKDLKSKFVGNSSCNNERVSHKGSERNLAHKSKFSVQIIILTCIFYYFTQS